MHIVYVITRSDTIAGAQVHVRELSQQSLARGHRVTVIVGGEGPFTEELCAMKIQHRSLKSLVRPISLPKDLRAISELRSTLAHLKPDLVASHSSKVGILTRVVNFTLEVPTIHTVHGWPFAAGIRVPQRWMYLAAEMLTARLATRIITVSDYDRELALRYRVAPAQKIVTIHNGVPDIPGNLRANPKDMPPTIVTVARFERQKDFTTLFKALAALQKSTWRLDWIGDGGFRQQAEVLARELGVRDRICFLGQRRDIPKRLAQSQIFTLVSRYEGFPLCILEAMRAGLPVVATNVGGVSESVRHGKTGILVEPANVCDLRHGLDALIRNPDLRVEFGAAGRERYERLFPLDKMVEKTLAVYKDVFIQHGIQHRLSNHRDRMNI
jgi:glycosyltransferase involved in cell wall biosynthesis